MVIAVEIARISEPRQPKISVAASVGYRVAELR